MAGGAPQLPIAEGDKQKGSLDGAETREREKKWTGFDPTGLERAATAVRELEKSRMES